MKPVNYSLFGGDVILNMPFSEEENQAKHARDR